MNRRRKATVAVAQVTLMAVGMAVAGYAGRVSAPDPLPACQSEDSPSCYWTDPDTGITYVNGYDAGMSVAERTGLEWCDQEGTVNRPCLEVIPKP